MGLEVLLLDWNWNLFIEKLRSTMSVDSYHLGLIGLTTIAVLAHFAVKCFTHSAVKCTTSYNSRSHQLSRLSILKDEEIWRKKC